MYRHDEVFKAVPPFPYQERNKPQINSNMSTYKPILNIFHPCFVPGGASGLVPGPLIQYKYI